MATVVSDTHEVPQLGVANFRDWMITRKGGQIVFEESVLVGRTLIVATGVLISAILWMPGLWDLDWVIRAAETCLAWVGVGFFLFALSQIAKRQPILLIDLNEQRLTIPRLNVEHRFETILAWDVVDYEEKDRNADFRYIHAIRLSVRDVDQTAAYIVWKNAKDNYLWGLVDLIAAETDSRTKVCRKN